MAIFLLDVLVHWCILSVVNKQFTKEESEMHFIFKVNYHDLEYFNSFIYST